MNDDDDDENDNDDDDDEDDDNDGVDNDNDNYRLPIAETGHCVKGKVVVRCMTIKSDISQREA